MFPSLRVQLYAITVGLPLLVLAGAAVALLQANGRTLSDQLAFSRPLCTTTITSAGEALPNGRAPAESRPGIEAVVTGTTTWAGGGIVGGSASSEMVSREAAGAGAGCDPGVKLLSSELPFQAPAADVVKSPMEGSVSVFFRTTDETFMVSAAPAFVSAYEKSRQDSLSRLDQASVGIIGAGALVCAVIGFSASRRIFGPMAALTTAARRLEGGDLRQRVPQREGRDEVAQLSHAFNAMAESIERTETLRRRMTSDVAHDLRTPLNNIAGFVDMMADGLIAADERALASLQEETQLLVRLVGDLDQLARGDAGEMALQVEAVDAAAAIQRAADVMRPAAGNAGVLLLAELRATPAAAADPARFDQVLRNLIENAIEHTPAGGTVTVSSHADGPEVVVEVADTGEGVPPEHLPFVFERFYRADPSRTRATGGAGLGLAIVRQIVEAHGGSVTAANRPGGGATFVIRLPVAEVG